MRDFISKCLCLTLAVMLTGSVMHAAVFEFEGIEYYVTSPYGSYCTVEASSVIDKTVVNIVIPETVKNNGIEYSVTSLGSYVFSDCENLVSIEIPKSISLIRDGAFRACTNLTSIVVDEENPVYDSRDNCNAIIHTSSSRLIKGCSKTKIPNGIVSIGVSAFAKCPNVTSIDIPNGVETICSSAFSMCDDLISIKLPNSVTSIESSAFSKCTKLNTVELSDGLSSIGEFAFNGCVNLTSIRIPQGVASIGKSAFRDCTGLTSLYIEDGVLSIGFCSFRGCENLESVVIPNSVTIIDEYAFYQCRSLTSVEIPESLNTMNHEAFGDCSSLTSVIWNAVECSVEAKYPCFPNCPIIEFVFGEKVKIIPVNCCQNLTSLSKIIIPQSVISIEEKAFNNCSGLKFICCNALVPPSTLQSFTGVDKSIPVYVPCESVEAYKAASEWKEFSDIRCIDNAEPVAEPVDEPVVEPQTTSVEITWPASAEADSYVITITLNGEPFCTLTFDASGLLVNIEYANEGGCKSAGLRSAIANIGGFRYNVTGLSENTTYDYSVQTFNVLGSVIDEYDGDFTTLGDVPTLVSESKASSAKKTLKYYENGRVVIERDGQKFDLRGVVVK